MLVGGAPSSPTGAAPGPASLLDAIGTGQRVRHGDHFDRSNERVDYVQVQDTGTGLSTPARRRPGS
jgi:hypothetical protein